MPQVQLDEQVFRVAQRRAADGGYTSVDEYIADVVVNDLTDNSEENPNLDHLFTPERLAEIDAAAEDIKAGKFFTTEQAREHFKQRRAAWIQKNGAR